MAADDARGRWSRRRLSIALLVLGGVGVAAVGLPWALDAGGGATPVAGGRVVDGSNGDARPVFDARALLTPTYLPAGYRPSREGVLHGPSYARTWLAGGQLDAVQLTVTVGGTEMLRPGYQEVVLARPTVRGAAAKVTKSRDFDDSVCVTWREGNAGRHVCTSGDPKRLLSVAELVRVAQGLR